jgi:cytochrome c
MSMGSDLLPQTGAEGPSRGRRRAAYRVVVAAALAFFSGAAPAAEPVTPLLAAADAAKGEKLAVRCKACHTLTRDGASRFGPALWNVVGRDKAAAAGFRYTPAFQKLGGAWDYESLNALLADPKALAPGTRMTMPAVKSAQDRADLIRYLRDLSDTPAALPSGGTAVVASAPAQEEDFEGLPPGPGREEVFYLCAACHSLKLVTQQGLPRDRWDELLVWMIEKQGMPQVDGKERDLVLDYLAAHYGIPAQRPGMMTPMAPPPLMPLPPPPAQ